LFLSQFGFQTLGHLERIITNGFDVQGKIERQKILEGLETHAIGNQGGPLRFHIQEFRGN
jgi:hypothetical protein